jgi:uncharacterized protein (DUF1501 family)
MHNPHHSAPTARREFIRTAGAGVGLIAFARFAPEFLVQSTLAQVPAPERDRTILVLVQLAGGNDGLNTVVPYEDDRYHALRPGLALRAEELIPLAPNTALHAALGPVRELLDAGQLGIVHNVGYPNPNRSHFRSSEIWETASDSQQFLATGWIGRYFDNACAGRPLDSSDPVGVHVSNEVPQAFAGSQPHPTFGLSPRGAQRGRTGRGGSSALLEKLAAESDHPANANASFLKHTLMDALVTERKVERTLAAYRPAVGYPGTPFGQSLRHVAALIAARLPTRVYFVTLGGFDTHSNQRGQHANLLSQLAHGLTAFQRDLAAKRLDDQVLTMTFSEFGRRPNENESAGTDHGTAAPLFVMGSRVRGGFHGTAPNLDLPPNRDLQFTTDFRSVYATVLDRWLGCPARDVLGQRFPAVDFL